MVDYTAVISQLQSARTIADISKAVSAYSASAVGSGGILYSGYIGNASAHTIAQNIVNG
jgi:hypothetical protein